MPTAAVEALHRTTHLLSVRCSVSSSVRLLPPSSCWRSWTSRSCLLLGRSGSAAASLPRFTAARRLSLLSAESPEELLLPLLVLPLPPLLPGVDDEPPLLLPES